MARSRSQSSSSVSLFPFLAVLVCAMGALILLLIVTTRRIRQDAIAKVAVAAENPPLVQTKPQLPAPTPGEQRGVEPTLPPLAEIVPSPDETDRDMAALAIQLQEEERERKALVVRLERERNAARNRTAELKENLKSAQRRLDEAEEKRKQLQAARQRRMDDRKADAETASQLQAKIRELDGTVSRLRRELEDLKLKQAEASSRFAVVPFDGAAGTTRRPIYIECTEDALRILPENVTISAKDLAGFTDGRNPLLAGTEALVHYWSAKSRTDRTGREPEPYVLLLVRPRGTIAYYAARKMLRGLDGPVGYELIGEDWELDLPPVDPQAQSVCQLAVDRLVADNEDVLAAFRAAQRSGMKTPAPGSSSARLMRFNRATGRFEVIDPDGGEEFGPDSQDGKAALNSDFGQILNQGKPRPFDGRIHAPQKQPQSPTQRHARQSAPPHQRGPNPADRGPTLPGSQHNVGGQPPGSNIAGRAPGGDRRGNAGGEIPAPSREFRKSRGFRLRASDGSVPLEDDGEDRRIGDAVGEPQRTNSPDENGSNAGGNEPRRLWPLDDGEVDRKINRGGERNRDESPGSPAASAEAGRFGPGGGTSPHGTSDEGPRSGEPGTTDSRTVDDRNLEGDRRYDGEQKWNGEARPDGSPRSGSAGEHNALPKSLANFTRGKGAGRNDRAIRGKVRWGLSDPNATIGFERQIRIWTGADQLRVGDKIALNVKPDETREDLFRRVVMAVEAETRSWGKPPANFYWVPTLRFDVTPGGNQHYERLKSSLHRLGLTTEAEFQLDATPPAQKSEIQGSPLRSNRSNASGTGELHVP